MIDNLRGKAHTVVAVRGGSLLDLESESSELLAPIVWRSSDRHASHVRLHGGGASSSRGRSRDERPAAVRATAELGVTVLEQEPNLSELACS
jgi:hypothetical protein